jgi:nucleotide-binding universal stress UspA family protein
MSKPILVGFDPTSADRAPVRFAVAASRFTGAPLLVVAVYADAAIVERVVNGQMEDDLATDARSGLEHIRQELRDQGVRAECHAVSGRSAPAGLHAAAEQFGAGLLVIGSTTRGRVGRVLPGSTAERLMHGAPCAIAVVPAGWERGSGLWSLGIAYTDTPEGREALETGLIGARRADAKVRVLTAVKPRGFGREGGDRPGEEVTTFDETGTEIARMTREIEAAAAAHGPGVEVETDISAQDPADFLIAASENVDMLVCGSRGYGPTRAVLLGGVSRKVTAAAACPVLVLARGAEAGVRELVDDHDSAAV